MGQVRTYDFNKGVFTIGPYIIKGFSEGSSIVAERDEDAYTKVTGADGEHTRSKTNNLGGHIEVSLSQSSKSNDDLSALATLDELTGAGMAPVMYKDLGGTTLLFSTACWVKKKPAMTRSKKPEDQKWMLDTGDLDVFLGGND